MCRLRKYHRISVPIMQYLSFVDGLGVPLYYRVTCYCKHPRGSVLGPEHLAVTQDLLLGSHNILQGHDPVEHHFPVAPAC